MASGNNNMDGLQTKQDFPIAVLIDADNISANAAEEIFRIAQRLGEPIVRRAYGMVGCFSDSSGWTRMQRTFGIVARPQVSNIPHKNVADIALVIDAMSLLYKSSCKGICIVSSDSDYTALAARIREEGKVVYGIGDNRAPESFRTACNAFFELKTQQNKPSPTAKSVQNPSDNKVSMPVKNGKPASIVIPQEIHFICPRCGHSLKASRTKSNQKCRICENCGGMSINLSALDKIFAEEGLNELLDKARKHEQAGCVCPDCGNQMSLLKVACGKKHVEIDVCGNCKAVWYDKDEFESLVPNDGMLIPTVSAGKAYRREMVVALTADIREGRLVLYTLEKLKNALKCIYHVPNPDIAPIIGTLQATKVISVDSKTGSCNLYQNMA